MRKLFACIFFVIACNIVVKSQKNFNLIISIDEDVVTSVSGMKFFVISNNGKESEIEADYFPGSLSVNENDFKRLIDTSVKEILLKFNYGEYNKSEEHNYTYGIEFKKGWFDHYFFVLRIYNLSKKKYKKMFSKPGDKEYEYEYPAGYMRLIRKI